MALETFVTLNRAADSLGARLQSGGTLAGLTLGQFGVLETLYHHGPMCQNELGARVLRSNSNITFVLDNLEKRALVERRRSAEDRRKVIVSLAPAGLKTIAEVLPGHVQAIAEELNVLSEAEQKSLGQLCRKVGKPRHT